MKVFVEVKRPRFARVRHWHERYGLNYVDYHRLANPDYAPNAGGMPAVIQLNQSAEDRPVSMTSRLQYWWYMLMTESAGRENIACWSNTTDSGRAFTNHTGTREGYADYVQWINPAAEPMRLHNIICNGATVKVLGDRMRRGGEDVYPIEVLDAFDYDTLNTTYKSHWWCIFPATNSTVEPRPFGRVDPFPYNSDKDVPIPLLGNHITVGYIAADWIEFPNTKPPYFPYANNSFGRTE